MKTGTLKSAFAAALVLLATPAFADLAADKAAVDAAKAAGTVGEQADGYLGIVGGANPAVSAAVNSINAGRASVYADTAAKSGTSRDVAGQATGAQLIAKTPPGEYIKPMGGGWTRK